MDESINAVWLQCIKSSNKRYMSSGRKIKQLTLNGFLEINQIIIAMWHLCVKSNNERSVASKR